MLINSYQFCRHMESERTGYAVLWAVMVLFMNIHDAGQAVAGLAIAPLVVGVCSDIGKQVSLDSGQRIFLSCFTLFTQRCSVFWPGDGQNVVGRQALKDDQAGNLAYLTRMLTAGKP